MAITIKCEKCGKSYTVPDETAGKKAKCRECAHVWQVPAKTSAAGAGASKPQPTNQAKTAKAPGASGKAVMSLLDEMEREAHAVNDQEDEAPQVEDEGYSVAVTAPTAHVPVFTSKEPNEDAEKEKGPPKSKDGYVACPQCKSVNVKRVKWTPWGANVGPMLIKHVKCVECNTAYHGKTGQSNLQSIVTFVVVEALIVVAAIFVLFVNMSK